MTDAEMIARTRILIGDIDEVETEATMLAYISTAKERIINKLYPYVSDDDYEFLEVPAKHHSLVCEIAAYLLDKRGAEGQTGHSENGVTRSYGSADIPDEMLRSVVPYAGVV